MSDGDGENRRECEKQSTDLRRKSGGDEFAQAIARMAVAQICEAEGFQTFQQSALDALADVAVRYIFHVGKTAHLYANLAGRTECNAFDVVQGLEDLGSGHGFAGASEVNRCLEYSGIVHDIVQFVGDAEEISFAYSLPQFPFVKDRKPKPSFLQSGEEPPGEHIPAWLPAFPEPHTYEQTSHSRERSTDNQVNDSEHIKQQSKVELPLQQSYISNGIGPSSFDSGDAIKGKQVAESNPFLAPPLLPGEKDVCPVSVPTKFSEQVAAEIGAVNNSFICNHVSVMETFAPAIEAMNKRMCDSEEKTEKSQLSQRPPLQFKIGIGKKSICTPLDMSSHKKPFEMFSPQHITIDDSERDGKKKRAENILKKSMENPEELA